jgi:hypothetical protein
LEEERLQIETAKAVGNDALVSENLIDFIMKDLLNILRIISGLQVTIFRRIIPYLKQIAQ